MSINSSSINIQLDTKRHSFAHLMAAAVGQMFPEAQYGVGPVIETGCYYDFVLPRNLIPEDLPLLENHIKDLLKRDLRFKVQELSLEDAIAHFANAHQPLKVELLENLRDRGTTSMSKEEKADFGGENIQSKLANLLVESQNTGKQLFVDCIIFNEKGQVFVQKRSADRKKFPNCWELVGGGVEENEAFEQAVRRELKEELNFDLVEIVDYLEPFEYILPESMRKVGENINHRIVPLIVKVKDYSNPILEAGKADDFAWVDKNNLDITLNGNNTYTFDTISKVLELKNSSILATITIYRIVDEKTGEVVFEDLCKGPHVWGVRVNQESVKDLNLQNMGFKLDKFSASYWRGDQARGINMQRLYALVFETKDELKEFVNQREEAKKRDHRVLGNSLKLFTISDLVGSGLPLLQPKGAIIRKLLEDYLWQLQKTTHDRVYTPHITKKALYEKSGHAGKYLDDMFSVYGGTSKEEFYVKPMNCPMHMQIFADNQFSYKDMPVRYFDPTTVYRDEKTGQLSGMTRVRSITQDDGHIFCRIGQIEEEFTGIVQTIRTFYKAFGMEPDWVSWSVRDSQEPEKYLGDPANWDIAEESIRKAAEVNGLTYKRVEGEAAFYGPKLDFMFKDCIGREWQLSTIQCDFVQPERFDLGFKNEAGEMERPVVIHRAISGSFERFMGIMIEHFAGKFPFWMSPEQIRILTINDEVLPFVDKIKAELDSVVLMQPLKYNELRYSVDDRMESLGKKIRDSKLDKIPMFIVVGMKDVEEGIVSIEYNGESVKVPLGEVKAWMENIKN
jgi:threonyl-tRNA synthetase